MARAKPLVDKTCLLQKFPGKGGWTYAEIPEVLQHKNNPFGWVTVKGTIDGYVLKQYKLMPMGNGKLFLPVKTAIRKKIGKQQGDFVRVTLYADSSPLEIPREIMACFDNEPNAIYQAFLQLKPGAKKSYLDWIYQAKKEATKAERIAKMMKALEQKLKI